MCCVFAQAHINKFAALKTRLSREDWCSCFSRCPEVLNEPPAVLQDRVNKLQQLMEVSEEQVASTICKAPSLLQHDPQDIESKVSAGHGVGAVCTQCHTHPGTCGCSEGVLDTSRHAGPVSFAAPCDATQRLSCVPYFM